MRVAVDANVLAAALVRPSGWTAAEFDRADVRWVAPAAVRADLAEHADFFRAKARATPEAWAERIARLLGRLAFVPGARLLPWRGHAVVQRVAAVDPDDWPYAAMLVAGEALLLWTRDRALLRALPGLAVEAVPGGEGL